MNWQEILALISGICTLIPTLVSVFVLVRNIIKNKNWTLVMSIADAAMRKVEDYSKEHPGMSSDEKLEMALQAVKAGLGVANIKFDDKLVKRIIEYIKQSISWFNEMK